MTLKLSTVPIIPPCLKHEDAVRAVVDSLECLKSNFDAVVTCLESKVNNVNRRLTTLTQKIGDIEQKLLFFSQLENNCLKLNMIMAQEMPQKLSLKECTFHSNTPVCSVPPRIVRSVTDNRNPISDRKYFLHRNLFFSLLPSLSRRQCQPVAFSLEISSSNQDITKPPETFDVEKSLCENPSVKGSPTNNLNENVNKTTISTHEVENSIVPPPPPLPPALPSFQKSGSHTIANDVLNEDSTKTTIVKELLFAINNFDKSLLKHTKTSQNVYSSRSDKKDLMTSLKASLELRRKLIIGQTDTSDDDENDQEFGVLFQNH